MHQADHCPLTTGHHDPGFVSQRNVDMGGGMAGEVEKEQRDSPHPNPSPASGRGALSPAGARALGGCVSISVEIVDLAVAACPSKLGKQ